MTTTPVLATLASLAHEKRELDARLIVAAGEFAALSDRSLDKDGLARRAGYARPELMLAGLWHVTVQEAKRYCTVGLATRARQALDGTPLPPEYPVVAAAIASCELTLTAADIIIRELEAAAPRCSTEKRQIAEHELVTRAPDFTIADLHTLARNVRDRLDEDGVLDRDAVHRLQRSVKFIPGSNGMVRLVWDMPPATAGMVKTAIDGVVDHDFRAARDSEVDDIRTLEQRRADAAEHLFHHVATCGGVAGDLPAATMVVRLSLDDLRSGRGTASIDGIQETISIATARRLAADAELIPIVLGGKREVLDAGRARRLFSRTQRLALMERDDGCAFPGCTSPPSYADAHHIRWWSHGGDTDLANGVMLCGFHHHRVHDDEWEIRIREGVPYFIPPPWADPDRRERRGGRIELHEDRRVDA
ncbi:MAG: hypothetical protein JWN80_1332 [Microbacteriaceae bacterium]|nr:hypothetical protein [Microbacteriaceae bacterium]